MAQNNTYLDEVLAKRDKEERAAEMMQKSIREKDPGFQELHVFDNEIRKMPEDTHNKV